MRMLLGLVRPMHSQFYQRFQTLLLGIMIKIDQVIDQVQQEWERVYIKGFAPAIHCPHAHAAFSL